MKSWFDRNKSQYKRAKVRDILVTWGQIPKNGEKSRTDTEAAAIMEQVVKRFQAGESFTALVKEFSEDVKSKDKGGELPPIRPEDKQTNSSVKAAVFSLKPGEISKAVRMPGGIYLFQLIDMVEPTQEELNDEIITQIGREQSIQWIEKERSAMKLEIKDPAYFGLQEKK
jgi:parvulin-like peptidyl-prolyl isomerase